MAQSLEKEPDPFEGLYAKQIKTILTVRPTWSERWRMSGPMSAEKRRSVLIDIMMERRREYLVWYHKSIVLAVLSREEDRFAGRERQAALAAQLDAAHRIAERNLVADRMRSEGKERAAFYERKLTNGKTLAELKERRLLEIASIRAIEREQSCDRGR